MCSVKADGVCPFFYLAARNARLFVITKGENMQKVSYMGNGETTEFNFTFPYYESTNIIVTKNGAATTGYQIVGTSGGLDADIPYTGGKVVFETAPTALDSITIARSLPLSRTIDYQPTAKIDPTTVNQDMNYLMDVLKDLKDEFDTLHTQYTEIADKESATALLAQITAIHDEIVAVDAQITALGDISTLRQTVTDLSTTVGGHTTSIGILDTKITGISDYVTASQNPSSDNNYTWYRKYKSGWVEQGGYADGTVNYSSNPISLPITMADTNYVLVAMSDRAAKSAYIQSKTTTGFCVKDSTMADIWYDANFSGSWEVKGMAYQDQ